MKNTIKILENTSDDTGRLESVSISWNAIGAVSIEKAESFVRELNEKIAKAKKITIK